MENLETKTRFIMKKYGITANKSLGQNFLINEEVVNKIVDSSNISKDDLVIEIGPGLGTLTEELLQNAGKVLAIELDTRMITRILRDEGTQVAVLTSADRFFNLLISGILVFANSFITISRLLVELNPQVK